MKKIYLYAVLFFAFSVSGCSSPQETKPSYTASTYITKDMKILNETGQSSILLENSYTPEYMKSIASDVAIITVISLEKADMNFSSYTAATYGKLLINTVISGNVKEAEVVDYVRPGGVVSVAEYEEHDFPEAIEKRDYLRKQEGITIDKEHTYYDVRIEDDICLEAGKTYFAYMYYHEDRNRYEIIGLENGLSEIDRNAQSNVRYVNYDVADLHIKNNKTGTFESLQEYLDTYFPKR